MARLSKRDKVFALFDRGFDRNSDEVRKISPNYDYRRQLWTEWKARNNLPEDFEFGEKEVEAEALASLDRAGRGDVDREPKIKAPYKVSPKEITIGNIRIPYSDWGYSSVFNLLVVAATYEEVRRPSKDGGIAYPGKVGDFCAECVKLYRRIFDFDRIKEEEYAGQGVQQIPGGIEEENNE